MFLIQCLQLVLKIFIAFDMVLIAFAEDVLVFDIVFSFTYMVLKALG